MLSLVQWQNVRRVDHVDLGPASIRFRGVAAGLTNLKIYDGDVAAYPAAANDFDRVTILGRIVQQTRSYLNLPAGTVSQRYVNAVNALMQSALQDLTLICGGAYQATRNADLLRLAQNGALAPKTITVNVLYLAPIGAVPNVIPIDATINQHIAQANANGGYQRAGISVVRANAAAVVATQTAAGQSILLPAGGGVPANQVGRFADGGEGGRRLITYCNARALAPSSIDLAYLDNYEQQQNDVQGRTYRVGDTSVGIASNRPIVCVTLNPPAAGNATYPTTVAHELMHALTGCPTHSGDVNNLIAVGSTRNMNANITDGQIAWMRNNPWVT
ncbi:MAG: hypothetical protein ACREMA_06760 [Longimicrobiales bacterium]